MKRIDKVKIGVFFLALFIAWILVLKPEYSLLKKYSKDSDEIQISIGEKASLLQGGTAILARDQALWNQSWLIVSQNMSEKSGLNYFFKMLENLRSGKDLKIQRIQFNQTQKVRVSDDPNPAHPVGNNTEGEFFYQVSHNFTLSLEGGFSSLLQFSEESEKSGLLISQIRVDQDPSSSQFLKATLVVEVIELQLTLQEKSGEIGDFLKNFSQTQLENLNETWGLPPAKLGPLKGEEPNGAGVDDTHLFRFRLQGILLNSNGPKACINNKIVQVGQNFEGYLVDTIDKEKVVLSKFGKKINLKQTPTGGVK